MEVKLAINLRILAGASYLNVARIFEVTYNYTYEIISQVTQDWLYRDTAATFNLDKIVKDPTVMHEVAKNLQRAQQEEY